MSALHEVAENPDVQFEPEDIRATPVLKFLVGIAVTSVVTCLLLLGFYRGMRSYVAARQPPPPHMTFEESREPPPPRLQERPDQDLQAFRAAEDQVLDTYGWVDKSRGVVRIPIDEAMKLVAERGLVQQSAVSSQHSGTDNGAGTPAATGGTAK
jgi:hypothetical protein